MYSSGTTGTPKGIVLQHDRLLLNARRMIARMEYEASDVFLAVLPSFHLFGFSYDFLYPAITHARVVVMDSFSVEPALDLIEGEKVTVIAAVPTLYARMFDQTAIQGRDLSSIRLTAVGGGPVSPTLKTRINKRIGAAVCESYGMTEISTVATSELPGRDHPEGSCGTMMEGVETRIVDEENHDVPLGEAGEIWFRSGTFMQCYWNQPELTATTIKDGWLRTGDIGKLDEEGNLYILDRKKDMIVSNGFNVYPKEVENACLSHPAVESAGVVGLPDEIKGEVIHALVVLRPGVTASGEEILRHCEIELARYKRPRGLIVIDALPLTATGKVRRFKLREIAEREIQAGRSVSLPRATVKND
ncbi:class I adenylate-forming enzyme family protein [Oceanicola sp. 22II-s10i]|uniref:class I adenylate-forming enzyme family protein n=1 Tax=Oceanicola sp. 22II-s10i TaxID=1317116 RepID=UPI0020CFCDCD|nr:AMP-binding protein [Oceanicola sp. 22II-s10i]